MKLVQVDDDRFDLTRRQRALISYQHHVLGEDLIALAALAQHSHEDVEHLPNP